jgi:hypothetical protein
MVIRVALATGMALAIVGALGGATAAADDVEPPGVVSLQVGPATQTVEGFQLGSVRVEVGLRDASGVETIDLAERGIWPALWVERIGDAGPGHPMRAATVLERVEGDARDGIWSAELKVPSTWDGDWRVSDLFLIDTLRNEAVVDPASLDLEAAFSVQGRHVPALTMEIDSPDASEGEPITIAGRAWYLDTDEPIAGRLLAAGFDSSCPEPPQGGRAVTTGADGLFAYDAVASPFVHCVFLTEPPTSSFTPDQATVVLVEVAVVAEGQPSPGRPDTATYVGEDMTWVGLMGSGSAVMGAGLLGLGGALIGVGLLLWARRRRAQRA